MLPVPSLEDYQAQVCQNLSQSHLAHHAPRSLQQKSLPFRTLFQMKDLWRHWLKQRKNLEVFPHQKCHWQLEYLNMMPIEHFPHSETIQWGTICITVEAD